MRRLLDSAVRCFASLQLAVILLAILAAVLACATVLETKHGAPYARWYVYETAWFVGLLALLGINIFSAAAIRFPWKRHQFGFVVTHCGLLLLLAGAMRSFRGGIEGEIKLFEGETTQDVTLERHSLITVSSTDKPLDAPHEFRFSSGPADWPPGKKLDIGEVSGVLLRILEVCHSAHPIEGWVSDESKQGGPGVKLRVIGSDGVAVAESWLVDQQFGDAISLGTHRIQLQRAATDGMLKDFLHPSSLDLGEKGLLVIVYGDIVEHAPVEQYLGERIQLGRTGVAVEITSYLPNARPERLGTFTSRDKQPKNPMLELRVHLPDEAQPLRQIAFAKDPLLNLDGVYPRVCPVKFRFHHPRIQSPDAVELLQTRDGKLIGRLCIAGAYKALGEFNSGDAIPLPDKFRVEIAQYLEHASSKVVFQAQAQSENAPPNRKQTNEPAALVEVVVDGTTQQVWLRRNDPTYGRQRIRTQNRTLELAYGYGRVPLGFSLKLIDFQRQMNPGRAGNAAFSSKVLVIDSKRQTNQERTIAMNEPLTYGKFTLYQSGFDDAGHGRQASTFRVANDPGRLLKYSGSLMICVGIAIMFYMKAYCFKQRTDEPRITHADRSPELSRDFESAA